MGRGWKDRRGKVDRSQQVTINQMVCYYKVIGRSLPVVRWILSVSVREVWIWLSGDVKYVDTSIMRRKVIQTLIFQGEQSSRISPMIGSVQYVEPINPSLRGLNEQPTARDLN